MQKLIIGCGYLGRRVAERWLNAGHNVAALTRTDDNAAELRDAGIEPIIGDVTQPATLTELPQAETVLYAVGFDRNAGPSMREVYVDGLRNVLNHLPETVSRFLYTSSTSVYGQNAGEWVDEDSPCEPTRENGKICLEAEQIVQSHFGSRGCTSAHNILRLAGIYGPGRLLRRIEAVRSGEPVSGNPDAYLNLIHVDDAVQSVLACEERGEPDKTYLVSDNRPITRREYYAALANALNVPPPEFAGGSSGLNKRCRNDRFRNDLGVKLLLPSIDAGLPHAIGADS